MALPRQDYVTSLGDQLNVLAGMIKTRSRAGLTDGNKILETVIRKTFNALFGWNLVNLNIDQANFPAADLGDRKLRLAVQVTNEGSFRKITSTATKAGEHKLGAQFDTLIVFFLLTQKPRSSKSIAQPKDGPKIETWDNADIVKRATEIDDIEVIRRATEILAQEVQTLSIERSIGGKTPSTGPSESTRFDHTTFGLSKESEFLYTSFLPVVFPELIQTAKIKLKRGIKLSDKIDAVWKGLKFKGPPPVDYYIDYGTVYTFESFEAPLWNALVETNSIGPMPSFKASTWAKSGLPAETGRFIKLLQRNLEQLCNHVGTEFKLAWSRELKCYMFQAKRGAEIGKLKVEALMKAGTREIFRAIPNSLPGREGEIQHWKHQGFRHRFVTFGGEWFLNIEPFWAFTADGMGNPSRMHASSSRNMKKPERNRAVLGHVIFWASLLCKEPDMFTPPALIRLLRPTKFSVSPSIRDAAWKEIAPDDEQQILTEDGQEDLYFL